MASCEIPFSCKLDCNVLTPIVIPSEGTPIFTYQESEGTINLANVTAYFSFIKPDGETDETACVLLLAGFSLVVRKTYEEIDSIINPE